MSLKNGCLLCLAQPKVIPLLEQCTEEGSPSSMGAFTHPCQQVSSILFCIIAGGL